MSDYKNVTVLPTTYGGGPPGGDQLEGRIAALEAHVAHIQRDITDVKQDVRGMRGEIRSDFRQTFGAIILVALGLAGIMAKGFGWL